VRLGAIAADAEAMAIESSYTARGQPKDGPASAHDQRLPPGDRE